MILFKPEHVAPILEGRKTQTRRLGKKRWNVGAVHQCRTKMLDAESTFASVLIRDVRREWLDQMRPADALAEGYESPAHYFAAFDRINGLGLLDVNTHWPKVWVVEFALIPGPAMSRGGA